MDEVNEANTANRAGGGEIMGQRLPNDTVTAGVDSVWFTIPNARGWGTRKTGFTIDD